MCVRPSQLSSLSYGCCGRAAAIFVWVSAADLRLCPVFGTSGPVVRVLQRAWTTQSNLGPGPEGWPGSALWRPEQKEACEICLHTAALEHAHTSSKNVQFNHTGFFVFSVFPVMYVSDGNRKSHFLYFRLEGKC